MENTDHDIEIAKLLDKENYYARLENIHRENLRRQNIDPIKVFRPTKQMLQTRVNYLKTGLETLRNTIVDLKRQHSQTNPASKAFLLYLIENTEEKYNAKLREYEQAKWTVQNTYKKIKKNIDTITAEDIQAAKLIPCNDFIHTQLKQTMGRWTGRCPLHDEKTASFVIYMQTNTWYCFGACSEGGDVIKLVQRLNGLSFIPAIRLILGR